MTRRSVSADVLRANPAIAHELVAGEWESDPDARRKKKGKSKDSKPLWFKAWRKYGLESVTWVGEGEGARAEFRPIPGRQFRVDAALPAWKIAVEVDGGNQMVRRNKRGQPVVVGRHTKDEDYWKLNELLALGWAVFRFTKNQLESEESARTCVLQVVMYMKLRGLV